MGLFDSKPVPKKTKHSIQTKRTLVPISEFEDMKNFLLAQIKDRDKRIEELKTKNKLLFNMTLKKKDEELPRINKSEI